MRAAATYLRSSKDRSDVSIAAQRHALAELAKSKDLTILGEYSDAVESGKDEDRPGFQRLLRDLKSPQRRWQVLLAYDTSRIARRRYIAQALGHEAKKAGVTILYARVPEVDPITTVLLESMLQAMDEVHSLMSREKGLAGMAENVRRGFRAGGRAPIGYKLDRIDTGAVREGQAVMKSRLMPDERGAAIAAYLQGRAGGRHGTALAGELGLEISRSGLVDVEWNALTYAGHTVWNMRRAKDGQAGGSRRPRAEWQIQPNTHPALISQEVAEQLLGRLEARGARPRRRGSDYLLAGILVTPGGAAWHGDGGTYRTKGGSIDAPQLERAVLGHVATDLSTPTMIKAFAREVGKLKDEMIDTSELEAAKVAMSEVEKKIARITGLLAETSTQRPLMERLELLELDRRAAAERRMRAQDATERARALDGVAEPEIAALLAGMATNLDELDRDALKDVLRAWLARIELDPATRAGRLTYRLTLSRDKVASPPRRTHIPVNLTANGAAFYMPRLRRGARHRQDLPRATKAPEE